MKNRKLLFLALALLLLRCSKQAVLVNPAPTVTGISPATGTTLGGTGLTITGTGFVTGATVKLGTAACGSPTLVSSTKMTCNSGAYVPNQGNVTADVKVTNTDGKSGTLAGAFAYVAPEIQRWTFQDGGGTTGANADATKAAYGPVFGSLNGKLYAAWSEANSTHQQTRVAVFTGTTRTVPWTFVDGGGINTAGTDGYPSALAAMNGKLYATWTEGSIIRVAVYNGNDASPSWTNVDGGTINQNPAHGAQNATLGVFNGKLYATWSERTARP